MRRQNFNNGLNNDARAVRLEQRAQFVRLRARARNEYRFSGETGRHKKPLFLKKILARRFEILFHCSASAGLEKNRFFYAANLLTLVKE